MTRLSTFTQLTIGFSGGLDSTVLLHALAAHVQLRHKLRAVHVHHGMSPHATFWQNHCKKLCADWEIPFLSRSVQFNSSANFEEEARDARHGIFSSLLGTNDCLLLGHHRDDQAETLLLQLFRGAGIDGLAAMPESGSFASGSVARPFLSHSRQQLEEYARSHELTWIEDESNENTHYSRNYLRHKVLPLLTKKWPAVVGNICRTALHCQEAKTNLEELAMTDLHESDCASSTLLLPPLKKLSPHRLGNVLRFWLKKNQATMPSTLTFQRLIAEVIFARHDATPEVCWDDFHVHRYQNRLYINKKDRLFTPFSLEWTAFPAPLINEELQIHLIAKPSTQGLVIPDNATLKIQFRKGGEHLNWHGQTKQLKKLFQEWAIPPWRRKAIPLLYINEHLAAVVGYAISDIFYSSNAALAWELLTFR